MIALFAVIHSAFSYLLKNGHISRYNTKEDVNVDLLSVCLKI